MILLGFCGYATSGKDAAVSALCTGHGFVRVAFADALRDVLYDLDPVVGVVNDGGYERVATLVDRWGWDQAKQVPEVRQLLQRLGVAVRDHVNQDAWVTAAFDRAEGAERLAVSDVRFPNEAEAIKARGGHIVRVMRPGVTALNSHVSEHALDEWPEDFQLYNDRTLGDLGAEVDQLLARLGVS